MLLLILYFSTVVDGRERRLLSQQLQRRFHLKEFNNVFSDQFGSSKLQQTQITADELFGTI